MGNKEGRLRRLSVKDGLLKETIVLQKQIGTLLKCNVSILTFVWVHKRQLLKIIGWFIYTIVHSGWCR